MKHGLNDFLSVLFYPYYYLSLSFIKRCQRLFFSVRVHLHSELSFMDVYNICVRALEICFLYMLFNLAPLVHQRFKCYFQSDVEVCRNIEVCGVLSVPDGKGWGSFSLGIAVFRRLWLLRVFSHRRLGVMCLLWCAFSGLDSDSVTRDVA